MTTYTKARARLLQALADFSFLHPDATPVLEAVKRDDNFVLYADDRWANGSGNAEFCYVAENKRETLNSDTYGGRIVSFSREVRKLPGCNKIPEDRLSRLFEAIRVHHHTIHMHTGDDLFNTYRNGPGSCMGSSNANRSALSLYVNNPGQVAVLTTTKCTHRCLVWTDDNGVKLLDRTYPGPHPGFLLFAQQNFKTWTRRCSSAASSAAGEPFEDKLIHTVTLQHPPDDKDRYPYLDSMIFVGSDANKATFLSNMPKKGVWGLGHSAGGAPARIKLATCKHCNELELAECQRQGPDGKTYCRKCWDEMFQQCRYCGATHKKEDFITAYARSQTSGKNEPVVVCKTCVGSLFMPCTHCGVMFLASDFHFTDDQVNLCAECNTLHTVDCPVCEEEKHPKSFYSDASLVEHCAKAHPGNANAPKYVEGGSCD